MFFGERENQRKPMQTCGDQANSTEKGLTGLRINQHEL